MKKSDGMLVSREYLERLDAAVFGTTRAKGETEQKGGENLWDEVEAVNLLGARPPYDVGGGIMRGSDVDENGELFAYAQRHPTASNRIDGARVYWGYKPKSGGWIRDDGEFMPWTWAIYRGRWEIINPKRKQERTTAEGLYGYTAKNSFLNLTVRGSANTRRAAADNYENPTQFIKITLTASGGGTWTRQEIETPEFYYIGGGD